MARNNDPTAQIEQLKALLARHGIRDEEAPAPMQDRPDYIPHGSERHATFLGLVIMTDGDEAYHLVEFTSPRTGKKYRLEDEMGAIRHYPGIDPEKAIMLVLQQKVNELEILPTAPVDAPPMFTPAAVYGQ
jgi:hypothetical protein